MMKSTARRVCTGVIKRQLTRQYSEKAGEIARAVMACYNQHEIDAVAEKESVRLTPMMIVPHRNRSRHLLSSAQFLRKELPVRLAHRIKSFQGLPFIIGCNHLILRVHEAYIRSFKLLHNFPEITTMSQVNEYARLLEKLLEDHKEDVNLMAIGFRQSHRYLSEEMLDAQVARKFLDRMLSSRLAIRLLAMHQIHLHKEEKDHIGMIEKRFSPAKSINKWTSFVTRMCQHEYGKAPKVRICGSIDARFPYIPMPWDYIMCELLKNAMRASVEHDPTSSGSSVPDVVITIVKNPVDFIVKVSDRGLGIPHDLVAKVVEYNFTTVDDNTKKRSAENIWDDILPRVNGGPDGKSKMHGHGFGLPMSKCYAEYMGGSLNFQSMQGYGTDVFLRLKRIDSQPESFRF